MKRLFLLLIFSLLAAAEEDSFETTIGLMRGTFTLGSWQSKIELDQVGNPPDPKRFFSSLKPKLKQSSLSAREIERFIPSQVIEGVGKAGIYQAAVVVKPRPSQLSQFHFVVNSSMSIEYPVLEDSRGDIFVVINGHLYRVFLCSKKLVNGQLDKANSSLVFVNKRLELRNLPQLKTCQEYRQKSFMPQPSC